MKTVKEVSELTGISVRTLHYYDEIGLFKPTEVSEAGYRLYDDKAIEKLGQILVFRELDLPLSDIKLIMENPYSEEHYLRRYWCYQPAIIDRDRRDRGDYFKKPTQYWFVNCEPKNNFIFEALNYNAIECRDAIRLMKQEDYKDTGAKNKKVARSMIHPDYANRFIREYILDEEGEKQ